MGPFRSEVVLIVDDEDAIGQLLVEIVADMGHRPIATTDPEHALVLARSHCPGLVFSDLMMPRVDGLSLFARLRGNPALQQPVVALMSAGWRPPPEVLGPTTLFLPKPLDLDRVEELLHQLALGFARAA